MRTSAFSFTCCLLAALCLTGACGDSSGPGSVGRVAEAPDPAQAIDAALDTGEPAELREGLAAAIVVDVSGSMNDRVRAENGRHTRKIDVARRAARDLIEQFVDYAGKHPGEPVLLGIYEFSRRNGQSDLRPIVQMGPPDRAGADAAIARLQPDGGTPIGQAMLAAAQALNATGLTRRHLLIVSDGENTDGYTPEAVAAAIGRRPEGERPSIYFVAFDIEARRFSPLKDAGALVLSASNARELKQTLDTLITGSILVE